VKGFIAGVVVTVLIVLGIIYLPDVTFDIDWGSFGLGVATGVVVGGGIIWLLAIRSFGDGLTWFFGVFLANKTDRK